MSPRRHLSEPTPILLFGAGGHCKSCINLIEGIPRFKIKGIIDRQGSESKDVLGHKVLGTDSEMSDFLKDVPTTLIAVGQIKSAQARIKLFEAAKAMGAKFPVVQSASSFISRHSTICSGTAVFHQVIVNASAQVGENCILNNKALIEHDVVIGPHCHISTGALVNGCVIIEKGCFVGSGAILHEGIKIGENSVIPAGKIVRRDIPKNTIVR